MLKEIEPAAYPQSIENSQDLMRSFRDLVNVAMKWVERGTELPIGGKEVFLSSTENRRMYRVSTVDDCGGMEIFIPSHLYIHGIQLDENNNPIHELVNFQIFDSENLINKDSISDLLGCNPKDIDCLAHELKAAKPTTKTAYTNSLDRAVVTRPETDIYDT